MTKFKDTLENGDSLFTEEEKSKMSEIVNKLSKELNLKSRGIEYLSFRFMETLDGESVCIDFYTDPECNDD